MSARNPRVRRDELASYVGKKVMIGTQSYHYISGRLVQLSTDANQLEVRIGDRVVLVPLDEVATIQEAPESQAEYIK